MNVVRRPISARGFTLLEVLVSLAFVAIVSVALVRATVSSQQAAQEAERQAGAQIVLRSLLAQVVAAERVPFGVTRGATGSYRWTIAGTPTDAAGLPQRMGVEWTPERVAIEVNWGANGRLALDTLRLVRLPR
jgi:prepilin-type N-terminal cleavage/methylation domain-containing protein